VSQLSHPSGSAAGLLDIRMIGRIPHWGIPVEDLQQTVTAHLPRGHFRKESAPLSLTDQGINFGRMRLEQSDVGFLICHVRTQPPWDSI